VEKEKEILDGKLVTLKNKGASDPLKSGGEEKTYLLIKKRRGDRKGQILQKERNRVFKLVFKVGASLNV